jgi:hypothetical protein
MDARTFFSFKGEDQEARAEAELQRRRVMQSQELLKVRRTIDYVLLEFVILLSSKFIADRNLFEMYFNDQRV